MHKNSKKNLIKGYDRAISEFCSDNKDSSIYLVGEISHPGISDLDFLIVDNKPIVSDYVRHYLCGGNILIMPSQHMKWIRNLENLNLKHLQGSDYHVDLPSKYFNYVEILEWLPERILKCKNLNKNNVSDRRQVLLLHKSINRSIQGVELLTGKKYNKITTSEARGNLNLSNQAILTQSIKVGLDCWQDFENFLCDKKLLSGNAKGKVFFNQYYNFDSKFNCLMLYLKCNSHVKVKLSKVLSGSIDINTENLNIDDNFHKFIIDRWKIIDKIYNWFLKNKIDKGLIKYGWFLQ